MTTSAKSIGRLHVITDTTIQSRFTHSQLAKLAIAGGADTIQFRQKSTSTRLLVETAFHLKAICDQRCVPLIINDRADIALAVEASGAHFGQEDLPIGVARRILPSQAIIGASARTKDKIMEAISAGADYIGFGPVFRTSSKSDAEKPKGLSELARFCQIASCPVIAIGGITLETVQDVMQCGAHGIAVISSVCTVEDPMQATRQLILEIQQGLPV
ncbi:MAG: thiamine phosphate synthase [Candidatus Poribacteria bacterium]|nr:thiamine phosphate synthase [Candidatus Poribacteria bacterium]